MGQAEKDLNNDANFEDRQDPPPLDAVLPDSITPAPEDIFKEMDDFQKRLETEWESAKGSYQQKIDQIMTDFIQLKEKENPFEANPKAPIHPKEKIGLPPPTDVVKKVPRESTPASPLKDPAVDEMFNDVQKALKKIEKKSRHLSTISFDKPSVINMPTYSYSYHPWYRRIFPWLAGLCLITSAMAAYWFFVLAIPPYTKLPYTHTTGLLINNSELRAVDWFRKALYVHSMRKGFPIVSVENLPNPFVAGFCITNKALFSLDGMNQNILEHSLQPDHRVMNEFAFPDRKFVGLGWDENDLWTFDQKEKMLIEFKKTDFGEIKNQYAAPHIETTAFQIMNNRVWILSGNTRELLIYRLQNPLRLLQSYDLDPFITKGSPTGFAVDKKTVWVMTDDPAGIIKIPRSDLQKTTSNP